MIGIGRLGCAGLLASLLFGVAGCADKNEGFVAPKVGTQFAWKFVSEEGIDDGLFTVVATGPDFAIFEQSLEKTYFAEFSATGFSSCEDEEKPSRKDRQKALSAWPPIMGTEFKFMNDTILIEKEDTVKIGEQEEEVVWIVVDYPDADVEKDRLAISTRYQTPIIIDWPEDARDFVVSVKEPSLGASEVQPGYFLLEGIDQAKLGHCAKLLTEPTPITVESKD